MQYFNTSGIIKEWEHFYIRLSGFLKCRHSYNIDDIAFDKTFAECVFEVDNGGIEIDFSKFHNLVENPASEAFGYCASHVG